MSVICPRCGRVDDGTSYTCPACFAVLHPELLPTGHKPKKDPYADGPGPAARAKAEAEAQRAAAAAGGYPPGQPPGGPGAPYPYPPPPYPPSPDGGNPYQAPGMPPPGYPQPSVRRPMGMPDPPSYLAQSILTTLFCCMPFGIVGIVFAAMTMSATGSGNWEAAESSSNKARMWVWIAFLTGLIVNFLYFMFIVSGGQRSCSGAP